MTRRLLAARRVPNGNWMWRTGCGIISGGTVDVSDLTEPSEAGRRRADGTGQVPLASLCNDVLCK
jgi:hypothetical protein